MDSYQESEKEKTTGIAKIVIDMATDPNHSMWNADKEKKTKYRTELNDIHKHYIWSDTFEESPEFDYCMFHWNGARYNKLINVIQYLMHLETIIETNQGESIYIKNPNGQITRSKLTGLYRFNTQKRHTYVNDRIFEIETEIGYKAINPDLFTTPNLRLEDITMRGWKFIEDGEIDASGDETILAIGKKAIIHNLCLSKNNEDRAFSKIA